MASNPFIKATDARGAYEESKKWYRPYDEPIEEYERLQRNRPSPKIDVSLPRVTDGTLAAINQESPKRVVQQIPTGIITNKEHPEFNAIGNYLLQNRLIPMSCRMGSEIQKAWALISKAGTVGSASTYCYFTSINGELYVEWILPYVKDILGEKGKTFITDSNVRFMRSWYSKTDLRAIINKEKAFADKNKSYVSDWDLNELSKLMNEGPGVKAAEFMTPAERERGDGNSGGYEVIHAFQVGKDAEFFSFCPNYEDGRTLRTKVNKDPRGKTPFDDMYWNIDHSNPRGRGQIELSGGIQNLMDQQLQGFSYNSVYMQAPALKVWGSVDKASLKIKPNALWDMGSNPANKVERDEMDNTAIANFTSNMQFLQSKIYNLNSAQDNSIAASDGDVNQSKTQAGVEASQQKLGVSDNYIRKQFEEAWGNMTETRLNLYLAEMTGTTTLKLEADDLAELKKSDSAQFLDDKGNLTIPYSKIEKIAFKFNVDGSSSEVKQDTDNAEKLTEVLKLVQTSTNQEILAKEKQILKLLVDEIGAEGTDDLFPEMNQRDENGMPIEQAPQQQGPDPAQLQEMVAQMVEEAMKAKEAQPKSLAELIRFTADDLTDLERAQVLEQMGIQPDTEGQTPKEVSQGSDIALKVDKQTMDEELAMAKFEQEQEQTEFNNSQAARSSSLSEWQAEQGQRNTEQSNKLAEKTAKQKLIPAGAAK